MKLHRLPKQIVWAPGRVYQDVRVSVMFVKPALVRLFLHREEELLSREGGRGWVLPYLALKDMCERPLRQSTLESLLAG